jgi:hypothetical protein
MAVGLRHLVAEELRPVRPEDGRLADALARCEALRGAAAGPQDAVAVAETLAGLAPELDRGLRFRARIGAGVAATLGRELSAGDAPMKAEAARLAALLGTAPPESEDRVRELQRELAREVRSGRLDDRLEPVVAALRQGLADRLAISRPGWTEVADDGRG